MPKFVEILDLRGGRNGADPPISLPENQAVEMLNVDHYAGMLGRKRGGSEAVAESGGTAFATGIQSIFRHVPGSDAQAAEFWGLDGAGTPHLKRMAGGSTYADVTLTDNFTAASTPFAVAVSLNGKLFIAYDSAVDRLHCYDPLLAAPRVRVVGLRRRHRCSLPTWRIRAGRLSRDAPLLPAPRGADQRLPLHSPVGSQYLAEHHAKRSRVVGADHPVDHAGRTGHALGSRSVDR
jgi:hypothetical protein